MFLTLFLLYRSEDPTMSDGQSVNVDLLWDELQIDGPCSPGREVTCFMTQKLIKEKHAKSPILLEDMSFENLELSEDTSRGKYA